MNKERILNDYRQTLAAVQEEERQREAVQASPEYQALQEQIEALTEQQEQLLANVPDSREEHEADKQELIAYMQANNVTRADEFKAKTRAKRSVNVHRAWQALGGDYELMEQISSVKIGDIKAMAKQFPEYKKDLNAAIVDEGFIVTGITHVDDDS